MIADRLVLSQYPAGFTFTGMTLMRSFRHRKSPSGSPDRENTVTVMPAKAGIHSLKALFPLFPALRIGTGSGGIGA
jgi:hypothetical protein